MDSTKQLIQIRKVYVSQKVTATQYYLFSNATPCILWNNLIFLEILSKNRRAHFMLKFNCFAIIIQLL